MDDRKIRPGVWLAVVGSLAVLAVVVVLLEARRPSPPPAEKALPPPPNEAPAPVASARPEARSREPRPATPASVPQEVPYIEGLVYGEIDLREALALMPDNIYWTQGAPTKDPEVLAAREAERKRRNEEYGRVLSGDASEDEVRAYYDYKKKVSADYLEFSEFMARRYRNSDNKEFVGMLELATKMHAEKLQQLPAELEDALARARERAKIREDWKRQKEEFGENVPGDEPSESSEFPVENP